MERTFNLTNTRKDAITNCFLWMFLGLGVTAISAIIMAATGLGHNLYVIIGAGVVTLITALIMGFLKNKMSSLTMKAAYGIYTVSMGVVLGGVAEVYSLGSVGMAFMVSSVLFLCVYLAGKFTNMDFTKIGSMCLIGVAVLIISELILFMLHVPHMTLVFAAIALVLFLGVTIFDIQRANRILSNECLEGESLDKMTIYFALQLHLDFINIFLRVLQLVAKKNN